MRRISWAVLIGIIALQTTGPACAGSNDRQARFQPFLTRGETTWSISAGARINDFDWSRASDLTGTASPNVEADQTWTDVKTLEIKAGVRHLEPADILFVRGGIHMEAEVTGGLLVDGRSRLSSYDSDNRSDESTRQSFGSIDGDTIGASVAAGYKIHLTGTPGWKARNIARSPMPETARGRIRKEQALKKALANSGPHISLTPLIGYGIDQQTYHREDAFNHVALGAPFNLPVGPFHTESDFITNWYGPFMGLEAEIRGQKHMLRLRGELHNLTYYGKGIQPSRDDLEQDPSYDHEADGDGILLKAEYAYALGEDYALTFDGFYRQRESDPGIYALYPLNADPITARLNEANDQSQGIHIGLRYNWN